MQNTFRLVLLFYVLWLPACSSLMDDIHVDAKSDPKARLSGYKSYIWLDDAALLLNDPKGEWQPPDVDISQEIKSNIGIELEKRGILLNTESPELTVGFFIGVDMQAIELKYDPDFDVDILKNAPKAGLIVVLIDTTTNFVIWMGSVEADLHENISGDLVKQRVQYAVKQLFKLLPNN